MEAYLVKFGSLAKEIRYVITSYSIFKTLFS